MSAPETTPQSTTESGETEAANINPPTSPGGPARNSHSERRRQSQACDGCRIKKRKCDGVRPVCSQCRKSRVKDRQEVKCTYVSVTKKRGPPRGQRAELLDRIAGLETMLAMKESDNPQAYAAARDELAQVRGLMKLQNTQSTFTAAIASSHHQRTPPVPRLKRLSATLQEHPETPSTASRTDSPTGTFGNDTSTTTSPQANEEVEDLFPAVSTTTTTRPAGFSVSQSSDLVLASSSITGHGGACASTTTGMDPMITGLEDLFSDGQLPAIHKMPSFNKAPTFTRTATFLRSNSGIWEINDFAATAFSSADSQEAFLKTLGLDQAYLTSAVAEIPEFHKHLFELGLVFSGVIFPSRSLKVYRTSALHDLEPAIVNAMMASGARFSAHPDILRYYGTRLEVVNTFLKRAATIIAAREEETCAMIQAMAVVGSLHYEMDNGVAGCQLIGEACRHCQWQFFTGSTPPTMHNLLWNYEGKEHRLRDLHQDVREDRWMTWVMSILFDTYAGLASGFPCSVEEMDHPEVLKDRRPWEDDWLYLERTRRNMATAEASTPLRLTYTLFHDAEMGTSVDALSALCSTETSLGMTRMVQACFLVRRVMRFAREIKPQPSIHDDPAITLGAAAVLGCVAGESDGRSLHDALIQWYSTLRLDERVFESLSAFRTVTGEERARFEIQVPENQWSRNPLILHNSCLFLCALVLLHYPMFRSFSLAHPQQFPKTFRVNSPTDGIPIRVSCPEIFTLARRALVYIIHMCHIQAGLTKINLAPAPFRTPKNHATKMRDLSFTPDCPPVPPGLAVTPVIPLTILFVAMGDLTVNHTHSFAAKQEILASIEHTFLPVLDNMGRVTPLAVRLGCRLRSAVIKIVEGVVARQDSDILKWVDSVWTEEDE